MVKFPPGGRARGPGGRFRGPEAEPEVQPLIAQLKQDRADIAKAKRTAEAAAAREADERVVQIIAEYTGRLSNAIIGENKHMQTSHSEKLAVLDTFSFRGSSIDIDHKRLLLALRKWAKKNGIRIQMGEISLEVNNPIDSSHKWCIGQNPDLVLYHTCFMSVEGSVSEMIDILNAAVIDAAKHDKGNSAAGTRVRKAMQAIKNQAQAVRVQVQSDKNSR
jgi:hypothetical protein